MARRAPSDAAAPPWGGRQCVVLVDGPRDRWWYFADDWAEQIAGAERMGRTVTYRQTGEHLAHPAYRCAGVVWRFDAAAAERQLSESRRAGLRAGATGKARATDNNRDARDLALRILHTAATRNAEISADTIRADLDAAGVPGPVRGGLWGAAESRGWVRKVAERPSGGESAHGKRIAVYQSLIHEGRRSA